MGWFKIISLLHMDKTGNKGLGFVLGFFFSLQSSDAVVIKVIMSKV